MWSLSCTPLKARYDEFGVVLTHGYRKVRSFYLALLLAVIYNVEHRMQASDESLKLMRVLFYCCLRAALLCSFHDHDISILLTEDNLTVAKRTPALYVLAWEDGLYTKTSTRTSYAKGQYKFW